MTMHDWLHVPIGIDAQRWSTRPGCRSVLIAVHTAATCHRLLDIVETVECDSRIQALFTVAPDVFNHGVEEIVKGLGGIVLPWHQATRERFDLVLAAAHGGLHELHGPLVVLPHGAGRGKTVGPAGGTRRPQVYGLEAQRLMRDGRVLAAAVVLAHERERAILRRQCPDALPVAVVAGDPCYDRLVASLDRRAAYRRAYGVEDDQTLVVVSSTWGPHGLFGYAPDLLPRLMDQLPKARFRVAALLHPGVWAAHGIRQVSAWLRDCREAGLILPDHRDDWRAIAIAADRVIGDHGSVTAYTAALGTPLLALTAPDATRTNRRSAQYLALRRARRLDPARPLAAQLRTAPALDREPVVAALTSRPGQAHRLIRGELYRLLGLDEPGRHRGASPVAVPGGARP
jgi:hypothetical protein